MRIPVLFTLALFLAPSASALSFEPALPLPESMPVDLGNAIDLPLPHPTLRAAQPTLEDATAKLRGHETSSAAPPHAIISLPSIIAKPSPHAPPGVGSGAAPYDAPRMSAATDPAPQLAAPPATAREKNAHEAPRINGQAVAAPVDDASTSFTLAARAGLALGLLATLLWPLYARISGRRALEQATRARLHALVLQRPGITVAEAARAVGIDATTAGYHLRRLTKERIILRRGRAHHAPGAADDTPRLSDAATSILNAVQQVPGRAKGELAAELSIARTTFAWHLDRLEKAGLVRCRRDGRAVRIEPA